MHIQSKSGNKDSKITQFLGGKMRVLPSQFMIIVNNLEVETAKFLGKSKLNTIMSSTVGQLGLPGMMLSIEPMITEIVFSLTASTVTNDH